MQSSIENQAERKQRLDNELAGIETELAELSGSSSDHPDLVILSTEAEAAQVAVAEADAAAMRAEAAHSAARQALDAVRAPLSETERRVQRLETEAKTLAKLLHVDTKHLWPAVIDELTVEKGYEAALGAALGDDLEAPTDPSARHAMGRCRERSARPDTAEGVEPLAAHVNAPQQLTRRLVQIGIVERGAAPELVKRLRPGQRLVSREGDLWRWDGFSVAANAPTGAARRLAGRNRLADIEAELQTVRGELDAKRANAEAAENDVAAAASAEG